MTLVTVALLAAACTMAPPPDATAAAPDSTAPTPAPAAATLAAPAAGPTSPAASTPAPEAVTIPLRVERRTDDAATADFASQAMAILTHERGWARAGFRFIAADDAPYRLVLAEGEEVDRLCRPYDTAGRFSCQNGPVVALNADRWRDATPEWPGDLDTYRIHLVNHEVGHLLHLHHPSPQCPGEGLPAPVMLQQSTELGACTANPWPLPWEVDLAAARAEPLAPPGGHHVEGHRPSPPPPAVPRLYAAHGVR